MKIRLVNCNLLVAFLNVIPLTGLASHLSSEGLPTKIMFDSQLEFTAKQTVKSVLKSL